MERTFKEKARTALVVVKHAAQEYGRDKVSRMAAAVSYRTLFAIAPMLVVAVSIGGLVMGGNQQVQADIVAQVAEVVGSDFSESINRLLTEALMAADTAALVGIALLVWSASTLFLELQRDLNEIFDVPGPDEKRFLVVLMQRGIGMVWTLGFGLGLVALFSANAAVQVVGDAISEALNTPGVLVTVVSYLVSFLFTIGMFGLVFQTLTRTKLPWKPVWVGALITATLFTLAGYLTGVYFKVQGEPTALGFAGSVVVLLFLAYLLSAVFLFGAQVTNSYLKLVYVTDKDYLIFSDIEQEAEPPGQSPNLATGTIAAFLVGLVVGWRNRRRR